MKKLLKELKQKGLRIANSFELSWSYLGCDDDFNFVTVFVCDDLGV